MDDALAGIEATTQGEDESGRYRMSIDPRFLVERQGRQMVLYAGLLEMAHRKGLKSIRTEVLQFPTEANGQTTICRAVVEFEDGHVFSGIGDANPKNVGPSIAPHAPRMSETRSKARALRDGLSIGAVALEELGDLDEETPPARSAPPLPRSRPPATGVGRNDMASPAQVRALYLIGKDKHDLDNEGVAERARALYGRSPEDLSKGEASAMIGALNRPAEPR